MISGEKWMFIWRSWASSSGVMRAPLGAYGADGLARASIAAVRIIVLAVGRLRPPFADDVQHYQKLIAGHARLELIEVREEERVARRLPERAFTSLLDREGEAFDSESFARFLEERRQSGRDLCFVI